jgi:hypothetical protein
MYLLHMQLKVKSDNRPFPSKVIDGYKSPPDSSIKLHQHILTYEFQIAKFSFRHQNQSNSFE